MATQGSKGALQLILQGHSQSLREFRAGTQGKNLKTTPQRKAAYWPTLWLMLSRFAYTAQTHVPNNGAIHIGLDPPSHINH